MKYLKEYNNQNFIEQGVERFLEMYNNLDDKLIFKLHNEAMRLTNFTNTFTYRQNDDIPEEFREIYYLTYTFAGLADTTIVSNDWWVGYFSDLCKDEDKSFPVYFQRESYINKLKKAIREYLIKEVEKKIEDIDACNNLRDFLSEIVFISFDTSDKSYLYLSEIQRYVFKLFREAFKDHWSNRSRKSGLWVLKKESLDDELKYSKLTDKQLMNRLRTSADSNREAKKHILYELFKRKLIPPSELWDLKFSERELYSKVFRRLFKEKRFDIIEYYILNDNKDIIFKAIESLEHILKEDDIRKILEIEPAWYTKVKIPKYKMPKDIKRSHNTSLWDLKKENVEECDLIDAVYQGNLDGIKKAIEEDDININYEGPYSRTALMAATDLTYNFGDSSEILDYLIKQGADIGRSLILFWFKNEYELQNYLSEYIVKNYPDKISGIETYISDEVKKKYPDLFRSVKSGLWDFKEFNENTN